MRASLKRTPIAPESVVAVVGAGASGMAAARLARTRGAQVRLLERDAAKITDAVRAVAAEYGIAIMAGSHDPAQFQDVSLVIVSPGVPLDRLRMTLEAAGSPPSIGELEFAWRYVREPVIAVTGTSGKTTTVSLMAAMLEEAGKKVFLGGNIGTPLSEYVLSGEEADVLVLEASSFQLQSCTTFRPEIGVLLNISPNHLDHHASMREYVDAKFSMFLRQTAKDLAIFGTDLEDEVPLHPIQARIEYCHANNRFPETRLLGAHNQANLEAAFMAVQEFGVSEEAAKRAASAFAPLENRLEIVCEENGIHYINDSKGTTVAALEVALRSMLRPVHLVAGGVFKGGDLAGLRGLVAEKVRSVCLFGANREVFTEAWQGIVPIQYRETLEEAVILLEKNAQPGEAILLCPATSSYDQYPNYIERGNDFRRIAHTAAKRKTA